MRTTRAGRLRRPAALAVTTAVLAVMIPTGSAMADTGEASEVVAVETASTPTTETVVEEPVVVEQPAAVEEPADEAPATDAETVGEAPVEQAAAPATDETPDVPSEQTEPSAEAPATETTPDTAGQAEPAPRLAALGATTGGEETGYSYEDYGVGLTVHGIVGDPWEDGYVVAGTELYAEARADWYPEGTTFSYLWLVDGIPVKSGQYFTPSAGDVDRFVEIEVEPHFVDENSGGGGFAPVGQIRLAEDPDQGGGDTPPVVSPDQGWTHAGLIITGTTGPSGTAEVGKPITVIPDASWAPGTTFKTWWSVNSNSVGDPFVPSYTPTAQDVHGVINVYVERFVDGIFQGGPYYLTVATDVVDPDALPALPQGTVSVSGRVESLPTSGTTLTASTKGWPAGTTFTHRWEVQGDVRGEGGTFTPAAADLGRYLTLVTTASLEGYESAEDRQHLGVITATPTVTVAAKTVMVREDAKISVKVFGPDGGPTPNGALGLTLTARDGGAVRTVESVSLVEGAATFRVPGLAAGVWDIKATYQPKQVIWAFGASASFVPEDGGPYLAAEGRGSVSVQKVAPVLTTPVSISTFVATRAVLQASVAVTGATLPGTWTLRAADGSALASGPVGGDGKINGTIPVLSPGTHRLVLEVAAGKETSAASRAFDVVVAGEPAQLGGTPTAVLDSPKSATSVGQEMELVAEGFEPGEVVAFYLHSDPVFLGTAVADANGVARLMAFIPADVPVGSHTVMATGGTSGRWAALPVTLAVPSDSAVPVAAPVAVSPAAVPAGDELAVTGSQSGLLFAGSWLMLLVGGGLVLVARKVRALR
ncbi:hypothetical protein [Cellulomonas sp. Y8]|uniref:hypothetical protein n=1 Tax=Cellulomonas sp. Y8 TaxID=2591145 RepID=UPI003D71ABC9